MRRFEVNERGQPALPALDLDGDVVIGSGPSARLRLPAVAAEEAHVRIAGDEWVAIGEVSISGARRAPGDAGPIGEGIDVDLGDYHVRIGPAPDGASPAPPARTASLARELVRGLLGAGAAPALELVRGPGAPSRRDLAAPGSPPTIIGRGDEATWVILDEDLSREHAEIVRGWDGVAIRDLDSKNGTRVDGVAIEATTPLSDGARIELGHVELVFRDPAQRHLEGEPAPARKRPAVPSPGPAIAARPSSPLPALIAAAIAGVAIAGLIWVLAS